MKALPSAGHDERSAKKRKQYENIIIALTMIITWAVI